MGAPVTENRVQGQGLGSLSSALRNSTDAIPRHSGSRVPTDARYKKMHRQRLARALLLLALTGSAVLVLGEARESELDFEPSPHSPPGPRASSVQCARDEHALEAVVDRLVSAYSRGELTAVLDSFAHDAELLSYSGKAITGKDEIREDARGTLEAWKMNLEANVTDSRIFGERGFVLGYTQGWRHAREGGGEKREIDDTFVMLFLCEAGDWRISHLMWGAVPDVPPWARILEHSPLWAALVLGILAVVAGTRWLAKLSH